MAGNTKPRPRGAWNGAILPVDKRWALVWEDVVENAETARRIRHDPVDFIPASWVDAVESAKSGILEHLKDLARKEARVGFSRPNSEFATSPGEAAQ